MHNPITQQHAEQLLATATPNTWAVSEVQDHLKEEHKFSDIFYYDEKGLLPRIGVMTHENVHLAAASPDLARTVIWLWKQNQQQQSKIERLQVGFKAALEEVNDLSEETYNHMAGQFLHATPSDYGLEPGDME